MAFSKLRFNGVFSHTREGSKPRAIFFSGFQKPTDRLASVKRRGRPPQQPLVGEVRAVTTIALTHWGRPADVVTVGMVLIWASHTGPSWVLRVLESNLNNADKSQYRQWAEVWSWD